MILEGIGSSKRIRSTEKRSEDFERINGVELSEFVKRSTVALARSPERII